MTVKRIFILRPDNFGDLVLFSGAFRHLRSYYPHAEITLCLKKNLKNLMESCPFIDRIAFWEDLAGLLVLDRVPLFRRHRSILDLFMSLILKYKYRSDLFLLPVRSPSQRMHRFTSNISSLAKYGISGDYCNQTCEEDRAAESIYTFRHKLSPMRHQQHELLVTREFLGMLGIEVKTEDLLPEFWTTTQDRTWADKAVPWSERDMTLAICPGVTSLPKKFYPGIDYARALSMIESVRFKAIIFGSRAEKQQCDEVATALAECPNVVSIKNVAGRSTLRQLIEGLRRCSAVISQETGALHAAVALGKPTVGILGGGHHGRFYPWGNPTINRVADHPMGCYGCDWKCSRPFIQCIQEISPETIAIQLNAAMSNSVY